MTRRLFGALGAPRFVNAINHRLDHAYDRWVARGVRGLAPDLVVSYENAALHTFRQANAIGATCVLDAAAVHYRSAEAWRPPDPNWVDRQKDEEISLADAIIVCSEFAATTYRSAGVPADKVFVVPLGADVPEGEVRPAKPRQECRFMFAGTVRRLKGIDMLLDAFAGVVAAAPPATLTLVGSVSEPDLGRRAREASGVVLKPFMPQAELVREMAASDVLVLPSRFDSFGMVVPEAMAVGVPALVSERVGAKCIIEAHPDSGWIVPCAAGALRDKMIELAGSPEKVARASAAATVAARDFTWAKYRARVATVLQGIYDRHRKAA